MLGHAASEPEPDTWFFHCNEAVRDVLSDWKAPIREDGRTLTPGPVRSGSFAQTIHSGNGWLYVTVVPDAVCAGHQLVRRTVAMMTEAPFRQEDLDDMYGAVGPVFDSNHMQIDGGAMLFSRTLAAEESGQQSALILVPLFYLSLSFALTAVTVLTVLLLSEMDRTRRQFVLLSQLGMSRRSMDRTLFRQSLLFYLMPAVPPVLITIPFIIALSNMSHPGVLTGLHAPPVLLALTLGLFALIYLLYILVASCTFRRSVLSE